MYTNIAGRDLVLWHKVCGRWNRRVSHNLGTLGTLGRTHGSGRRRGAHCRCEAYRSARLSGTNNDLRRKE